MIVYATRTGCRLLWFLFCFLIHSSSITCCAKSEKMTDRQFWQSLSGSCKNGIVRLTGSATKKAPWRMAKGLFMHQMDI